MMSLDLLKYLLLGLSMTAAGIALTFASNDVPDLIGWLVVWLGGIFTSIASVAIGVLWGMQAFANEREETGR